MTKTFQAIHRQNLSEQITREIGLSIMRNDFRPGDVLLNEPELSFQFNVSRPVMREALKMLRAKGLIESRPRIGTRVRSRSEWNMLDPDVIGWRYEIGPDRPFLEALCEVRLMFEPMTARLAALRATEDEISAIEKCYRRMEEGVDSPDVYIPADLEFHAAICAAVHNELLQQIGAILAAPFHMSRVITSGVPGANRAAMSLHWAVMQAIRLRDEQAAEEAMRKLMLLTADDIRRAFAHKERSAETS
jgi:GntR family galactonate operon transcriptional repressor